MAEITTKIPNGSSGRPAGGSSKWTRIDVVFRTLAMEYGSSFTDKWRAVDPDELKAYWGAALHQFSDQEVMDALKRLPPRFPPDLPEFKRLCQPIMHDPVALFEIAVRQIHRRRDPEGPDDVWPSPKVYWAAANIGWYDMLHLPYDKLEKRWKSSLENAPDAPIPPKVRALPEPEFKPADPARVKELLSGVKMRPIDG